MTEPSCNEHSCVTFTPLTVDLSITDANSWSEEMKDFWKDCFKRPKHQSHANLVWPTIRKLYTHDWCRPVIILHAKYHKTYEFLFWPQQLSAWRCTCLPYAVLLEKIVQITYGCICTLSHTACFIDYKINLPGQRFATDTKNSYFLGTLK